MNMAAQINKPDILSDMMVIDADTHLTETHDLWTSRAPASLKDRVPQIKVWNGTPSWVIDGDKFLATPYSASAIRKDGYKGVGVESLDWEIDAIHPSSYDVNARLRYMDEGGIDAQIAYNNLLGFGGQNAVRVDADLRLAVTQIYNDSNAELQVQSGNRIFPMALIPWWNIKDAVAETIRCHKMGLRGINTHSDPQENGMPDLAEPYWYPLWETCTDLDMPVNFHIGSSDGNSSWFGSGGYPSLSPDCSLAYGSTMLFVGNCRVFANLILSLVLERFPRLKVVSVESGIGWIPFVIDALEFQMNEIKLKYTVPPWEIFRRQMYSCSWFERNNFAAMARMVGVDNVMFQTDFPHPACVHPGALNYLASAAGELASEERKKIFGGNAARVYNIPARSSDA